MNRKPAPVLRAQLRRLRLARQHLTLDLLRRWSNSRKTPRPPYRPEATRRILIPLPGDSIGEAVMATLFLNAVKRIRPDIEIVVASGPQVASLFADCDAVDRMIVAEDQAIRPKRRMQILRTKIQAEAHGFCLIADMRTELTVRLLSFLRKLRGACYLGHAKEGYDLFDLNVPAEARHTSERWQAAAELATGQKQENARPAGRDFCLPAMAGEEAAKIREYLGALPAARARILLNFYGSAPHRCFPCPEALNLLRLWRRTFPDHLLQLLPVPGREAEVNAMRQILHDPAVVVAPAPLSLSMSVALARDADLVFTPDTGMVHIASALDAPIVAIYEPNDRNFQEWAPLSERQAVLFSRRPVPPDHRSYAHQVDKLELMQKVRSLLEP